MGPKPDLKRDLAGAAITGTLLPFPDFGNSVAGRIYFVFEGPARVVELGQLL